MKTDYLLSIIIPAYKEGAIFGQRLDTLDEFLAKHEHGKDTEVVVMMQSDDTSGDREAAALTAKKFKNIRIINLGKRAGKGGAVRAGMFEATGQWRLFMDADLATPLHHFETIFALIKEDAAVAIGVRDLVSTHKEFQRKLITRVGNILAQVVLLPGIKDTQCGFKMFRADVVEEVFTRQTITGWGFDLEILALSRKFGHKIEIFEVNDWKDPKAEGLVGDSAGGAALQVLRDLFKVRWNLITRKYKDKTFHYEKSN